MLLHTPFEQVKAIIENRPLKRQERRDPNDEAAFLASGNMWWTRIPELPPALRDPTSLFPSPSGNGNGRM